MNEKKQEMDRLVDRVVQHQVALGKSDNAFVAMYQEFIGSGKNWTHRFKAKSYDELNLDKWLMKFRRLGRKLEGHADAIDINDALPITKYATMIYDRLQGTTTDRRIAWLIGDYGTGKTLALRSLANKHRGTTCYLQANEYWRENKGFICRALAARLNVPRENAPGDQFEKIIQHLCANPITLLLDEGHHGGVMIMKILKTLINETQIKIMVGTYGTALKRLESSSSAAIEEARQVLGRSIRPINWTWNRGVTVPDVEAYLRHVAGHTGSVGALARRIAPLIAMDGNFRQLADAIDEAEIHAGESDVTDDMLVEAVEGMGGRPEDPRAMVRKGVAA